MAITNVTARFLKYNSRLDSCDSSFYSSNKCVHTKKQLGSTDNTIKYFWPLKFEKYRFFTKICKFSNTVFAGSITRLPIIGPVSCRIFPVQKKAPTMVLKFYVRNFVNHPYCNLEALYLSVLDSEYRTLKTIELCVGLYKLIIFKKLL
jgi:hypothetical protein